MRALVMIGAIGWATAAHAVEVKWQAVAKGVEYTELDVAEHDRFHIVRIDPARAPLRAVMASAVDKKQRTAKAWCDSQKLVAAINLGMYLDDHLSNVGHAHAGGHVNQKRWLAQYKSVLAWGPKAKETGLPAATMLDLDEPGARETADKYENVVQNLRLVKRPGKNVWAEQPRRWSEAAVAMDKDGRVLFVFARMRHSMFAFNQLLVGLPLGVVAAMHVEGGPEASLCVRGKTIVRDLNGSYETGFIENDSVEEQWEIPNLLGVGTP